MKMSRSSRAAAMLLLPALAGCMVSYVPSAGHNAGAGVRAPSSAVRTNADEAAARERRLGELLVAASERRVRLTHSAVLAKVARERAEDMARRGYFSHTTPEGLGANTLVRREGYALPDFYDSRPQGNNIESLGRGFDSAEGVWRSWMGSTPHRAHLLGLRDEFASHTEYGVGYARAPGQPGGHYWVVLTARPVS